MHMSNNIFGLLYALFLFAIQLQCYKNVKNVSVGQNKCMFYVRVSVWVRETIACFAALLAYLL